MDHVWTLKTKGADWIEFCLRWAVHGSDSLCALYSCVDPLEGPAALRSSRAFVAATLPRAERQCDRAGRRLPTRGGGSGSSVLSVIPRRWGVGHPAGSGNWPSESTGRGRRSSRRGLPCFRVSSVAKILPPAADLAPPRPRPRQREKREVSPC